MRENNELKTLNLKFQKVDAAIPLRTDQKNISQVHEFKSTN